MNSTPSRCDAWLADALRHAGAAASGVAQARPVGDGDVDAYRQWISSGRHGEMSYLERYDAVRSDPRQLLAGARSVVSAAFSYRLICGSRPLRIASYALGDDYHEVIRRRLGEVSREIDERCGSTSRVCVDTAPLLERYWAVQAGVGFVGRHHQLIVPGVGSSVLLGEIVTTAALSYSAPCMMSCGDCMRCVAACPGGALVADGGFDARRCLSYLTIEYRGEYDDDVDLHGCVYGCDECQLVCPHNSEGSVADGGVVAELSPRPVLLTMSRGDIEGMTHDEYCAVFRNSAIRRAKLAQLQRNVRRHR